MYCWQPYTKTHKIHW